MPEFRGELMTYLVTEGYVAEEAPVIFKIPRIQNKKLKIEYERNGVHIRTLEYDAEEVEWRIFDERGLNLLGLFEVSINAPLLVIRMGFSINKRMIFYELAIDLHGYRAQPPPLLSGVQLEKFDKTKTDASEAMAGKIVGLYFAADWCAESNKFTPVLKDFYHEVKDEFEVIFASFDPSERDLKSHMEKCHGDWYHIPFGSDTKKQLWTKYGTGEIPALIIVKPDGTEVTKEGIIDVKYGESAKDTIDEWND